VPAVDFRGGRLALGNLLFIFLVVTGIYSGAPARFAGRWEGWEFCRNIIGDDAAV
jgi:hypothetical protein